MKSNTQGLCFNVQVCPSNARTIPRQLKYFPDWCWNTIRVGQSCLSPFIYFYLFMFLLLWIDAFSFYTSLWSCVKFRFNL